MNPLDQALTKLLGSLTTENDLNLLAGQFLELSETRGLTAACKPADCALLKEIVGMGLKSKLGINPAGLDLRLHHYPSLDFFHGGSLFAGRIVQCFFFRREKKGCISVATLAGEVHYLRISVLGSASSGDHTMN